MLGSLFLFKASSGTIHLNSLIYALAHPEVKARYLLWDIIDTLGCIAAGSLQDVLLPLSLVWIQLCAPFSVDWWGLWFKHVIHCFVLFMPSSPRAQESLVLQQTLATFSVIIMFTSNINNQHSHVYSKLSLSRLSCAKKTAAFTVVFEARFLWWCLS